MGKVISTFFIVLVFSLSLNLNAGFAVSKIVASKIALKVQTFTEVIKIEYVYTDGAWYLITYYSDGTIGVQQVSHPPID